MIVGAHGVRTSDGTCKSIPILMSNSDMLKRCKSPTDSFYLLTSNYFILWNSSVSLDVFNDAFANNNTNQISLAFASHLAAFRCLIRQPILDISNEFNPINHQYKKAFWELGERRAKGHMINVPDDLNSGKSAVSTFNPAYERVRHVVIINELGDVFQIITVGSGGKKSISDRFNILL